MNIKHLVILILVVLAFMATTGCFNLDIRHDVDYPAGKFKATMAKIQAIHAKDPTRNGVVNNLNILVYIGKERKMISLAVPKALIQATSHMKDEIMKNEDVDKYAKNIDGFDLDKLNDLDSIGPGLIIESKVTEGNIHALIWLD